MKQVRDEIFDSIHTQSPKLPPTMLYNEGWLLRLVLHWFDKNRNNDYELSFLENATWYSEAPKPR